jgi:hypothetical protein
MTDKHQPLRDALKAVTSTNWEHDGGADVFEVESGVLVASTMETEDASYIAAANPAAISALLADLDAAVEMLQGVLKIDRGSSGRIILEGWHEEAINTALSQIKTGRNQA